MGINIQLRSEAGDVLGQVDDADMTLSRAAAREAFSGTRLLKYVIPWSAAVFNQAQASDLSEDVRALLRSHAGTQLAGRIAAISPIIDRLAREPTSICGS